MSNLLEGPGEHKLWLIMMVLMLVTWVTAMEMSLVLILFFSFFHTANISLDTNNSFSGGEIYCSTCYTREFGPGGRSKFGEKTEVQD